MEQHYYKLLRYLIDTDGSIDCEGARRIVTRGLKSTCLYSYDAKKHEFLSNEFSTIFDFALEYFSIYDSLITDDILFKEITDDNSAVSVKQALIDVVAAVRETEVKITEFDYLYEQIINESSKNRLLQVFSKTVERFDNGTIEAIEYLQKQTTLISNDTSRNDDPSQNSQSIKAFTQFHIEEFKKDKKFSRPVGQYGLPSLDSMTGGLFAGELTLIAGPPNSGKSFLAQHIALHNSFNVEHKLVYASTENTDEQVWKRLICYITHIPLKKLNLNALTPTEEELVIAAADELMTFGSDILIVPANRCRNPLMLKNEIESHFGRNQHPLIVVDHMNLMKPVHASGDWRDMESVCTDLKNIALYFDTAVISPTHMNRKGTKNAEAGITEVQYQSLVQIADNIYSLTEDAEYPCIPPEAGEWTGTPGKLHLRLGRSRNSAKDSHIELEADFSRAYIKEDSRFGKPKK